MKRRIKINKTCILFILDFLNKTIIYAFENTTESIVEVIFNVSIIYGLSLKPAGYP